MPTTYIDGYKCRFYSSDVHEPPHVHVIRDNNEAKLWLDPVEVEYNRGYNQAELNRIVKLITENRTLLLERWNEHFKRTGYF